MSDPNPSTLDRGVLANLQLVPLFGGLSEADLRAVLGDARLVPVAAGTDLFETGQAIDTVYVIVSGSVEVAVIESGRRCVVEVARIGALLGDTGLFGDGRYPNGARTAGAATLLAIPAGPFLAQILGRFDLARRALTAMSVRLRGLVTRVSEMKLKTAAHRLGDYLLALACTDQGQVTLRLPFEKRLVAEQLGMTPETLSRAFARLAPLGVETRPDGTVLLADAGCLAAALEDA